MAVADSYAAFQAAQAAYRRAADILDRSLASELAREAFESAGRALTAARHASQAARLVTEARSAFPPAVVEAALKAAGEAAAFAAQASEKASNLAARLVKEPLALAGPRTREQTVRLAAAIDEEVLQQAEAKP